jgi:serine protease Do
MSIEVICDCGEHLEAPEPLLGKKTKCPKCSRIIVVEAVPVLQAMKAPAQNTKLTPQQLFEKVKETVVGVAHDEGSGTGFFLDKSGLIVTNRHVVGLKSESIISLYGNKEVPGRVVRAFRHVDLAFVKVDESPSKWAALADSSPVSVGQYVYAIGYPRGLPNTLTEGLVSAVGRYINGRHFIQTDAAINPGNSGGPLFNEHGEVVGVNTMGMADAEGLNFAVPAGIVRDCLSKVITEGSCDKHYCSICGSSSSAAKYCDVCGAQLVTETGRSHTEGKKEHKEPPSECPVCKKKVETQGLRYCSHCGTTL